MRAGNFFAALAALTLAGCGGDMNQEKLQPAWSMMPDMHQQPSLRALEGVPDAEGKMQRSAREPVPGTVPVQFSPYEDVPGLANPLPRTVEVLEAGRKAYNVYCIVCHGERGDGKGSVAIKNEKELYGGRVVKFPGQQMPPTPVNTSGVQRTQDAAIFRRLEQGGPIMPAYAHIPVETRWAIIHYLRVLYKAGHPTQKQLDAFKKESGKYPDPVPADTVNALHPHEP